MGLETDSLVSSLILSKGILGIGNREFGQVSRTRTIKGATDTRNYIKIIIIIIIKINK